MAEKLIAVGIETEVAIQLSVEKAASLVRANARDAIGNADNGYGWAPLAESTIADKERQGYTTPAPLLRTGELRDSIGITMGHHVAWVGSNNDKAVWHEFGTNRIPPRPFISKPAIESEELIHKIAVNTVGMALAGHRAGVGVLEVLEAIKTGVEYVNQKLDEAEEKR
ncbi:MAG: phage virion morphogenesis protein [Roseiarcus sp.]